MTIDTPDPRQANAERLTFLQEAVAASAALAAADELGVLGHLARGPLDAAGVARACAIGERGARMLVSALAGLGLIESDADGRYRTATIDVARLAGLRAPWDGLAAAVRTGRPPIAVDMPADAGARYPEAVCYLGDLFAPAAVRSADVLAGLGTRILDVGAGCAPWTLAIAARDPDCRVTAVELPAVIPALREAVTDAGLAERFELLAGDLFTLELGQGAFDLVVAGNLCHLFDPPANRRLVGRLRAALRPGGRLAIIDAIPDERLEGPRPVVLYALGLLLRTRGGRVYPFSTYVEWLRLAGFESIERYNLTDAPPATLILATRRG